MLPAISVNKGCYSHKAITLQPSLTVSPEGTQDGNRLPAAQPSAAVATPDGAP